MAARTILCFGDSNTHGTCAMRTAGDRRRHPRAERWPIVMAADLGADWEVIAEGHPGRTAVFADPIEGPHKNGQAVLPVLLETHRPLDLVIVMLGTNDLKARFGQSAHDVALGVRRLACDIQASDSGPGAAAPEVLLAAPACVREAGVLAQTFAGADAKSVEVPRLIAAVAERQGAHFADMSAVAEVDPVDGVHLSSAAHAAIGAALATAVREIFKD
ncbi:GDSL-type esterase/lipase family protein [uncultured Roseobacter sp.]|uniref:GDSL-type esterase/lipase family protein n=1 Tax=uncultured Roseobacter sp. TaxID=114847 RepID=UPI002629B7B8|nr:GDSL-type esterase/lipase family protein [uncultured Roseobacter sp.]